MKTENKFAEAAKRGFTLVELLVVVAILGILATIAVPMVTGHIEKTNRTKASMDVKAFDQAVDTYAAMKNKGRLPDSLDVLFEGDDPVMKGDKEQLTDPWGGTYALKKVSKKKFYVYSPGPDGQEGTDDDIRSDKKNDSED